MDPKTVIQGERPFALTKRQRPQSRFNERGFQLALTVEGEEPGVTRAPAGNQMAFAGAQGQIKKSSPDEYPVNLLQRLRKARLRRMQK